MKYDEAYVIHDIEQIQAYDIVNSNIWKRIAIHIVGMTSNTTSIINRTMREVR